MINHKHQVQAPFRSRTVAEDRESLHHPQERTGFIRYVLAQVAVISGLVYGIAENNPHFVVGSVVLCTASCVWFIRKMLRRERNAK